MKLYMYWVIPSLFLLVIACEDYSVFERAHELNTIESYHEYLNIYPQGQYLQKACIIVDSLQFEIIARIETIEECEKWLASNIESKYYDTMVDYRDTLIKRDILVYLGYAYGKNKIKKICNTDLNNMCLSTWMTDDIGPQFLDLYYEEKIALFGKTGRETEIFFMHDSLRIYYKDGKKRQPSNRHRNYYHECWEIIGKLKKVGITFYTDLNKSSVSRTYHGGVLINR